MSSDKEREYLLRAFDAPRRKIIVLSKDYVILAANSYTKNLYPENIIGKTCYRFFHELAEPCENCAVVEAQRTRKPAIKKLEMDQPQESPDCRYSYPLRNDEEKDIDAFVALEFDRPSNEEVEGKLKRANAFLRNLILSSVDGVMAADRDGNILIFNDAASKITGWSEEEALKTLHISDIYPGDGARQIMRKLRSAKYGGEGKLKSHPVDIVDKNGKTVPISLNAAIIYEDGEAVASMGFFHDMTEEIKIKNDLEKTQMQLLQAEKMSSLGELSAGVAHQLNNPLGGITLYAKLMAEEYDLEEGAREDLKRITHDAERCSDIVKELLAFARQRSHEIQPGDINEALSRTLFLLENQTLFHNIEINKQLGKDIPLLMVDIQQINHAFMNIILNAAQAMEGKGSLTIVTDVSPEADQVVIQFSDTGPGISDDILKHIFEPFFTTKEEGKGTGLGLSMVYGIITDHQGSVTAESEVGVGTTMVISLPIIIDDKTGETRGD